MMGTTINPLANGGPEEEYGPTFPGITGRGMGRESRALAESRSGTGGVKVGKMRSPKSIVKEAEGVLNPSHSKPKKFVKGTKPKNLRASGKKGKRGAFGEKYQPPAGNSPKGIRVAESERSDLDSRLSRFSESARRMIRKSREKAPPGWEDTVKKMKHKKGIDNPFALAWSMKNQGDKPHH
jgi:hypothetical protein